MSAGKAARLDELRAQIPEVAPAQAAALVDEGAVLIDVREPDETAQGSPERARRIVRGFLELRIEDAVPDRDTTLLTLCAGGVRSLFAADDLRRLGYTDVRSVAGGFSRWKSEGLPFSAPRVLTQAERERYGRHLSMPEVGEEGQIRIAEAKILLLGAGGLGSPAALYLAAAGVGTLGIVDDDVVDRSNLQRQILHRDGRVGQAKVDSAEATLLDLNPSIDVRTYAKRVTADNVEEIFRGYDVVIDGSDNFPTRYLVNDACVKLGIPNVHGSIFRFEGQVSVFAPTRLTADGRPGPCYRCAYPSPPPAELAPSCAEAGVLGVLPGVVGTLEAVETLKLVLDIGEPLVGRLLAFDALEMRFDSYELTRQETCTACGEDANLETLVTVPESCGLRR